MARPVNTTGQGSIVDLMKLVALAAAGSMAALPFYRTAALGSGEPLTVLALAGISVPLVMAIALPILYRRNGRRTVAFLGLLLTSLTAAIAIFIGMCVVTGRAWWERGGPVPPDPWEVFPFTVVALLLPAWIFLAVSLERRLNRNRIEAARSTVDAIREA